MTGEFPLIGWVIAGWLALLMAFIAGSAWRGWTHRCRPIGIHDLDDAYQRGRADERVRREQEIRALDEWSAR
jgi:hypothetical protein